MADDGAVTETYRVVVEIEVNRPKVRACGAAEWLEGTRQTDVAAVITHRIHGAFNHVEGFEAVRLIGKGVVVHE